MQDVTIVTIEHGQTIIMMDTYFFILSYDDVCKFSMGGI